MTSAAAGPRLLPRLAMVIGLALTLRMAGLSQQPLIDDDRSVGVTAANYTGTGWPFPTMWNHPRLRDPLVAGAIWALGDGPWGLKVWSVLLGTLSVAATAWLVLEVGAGTTAALAAALVVAVDPLHVDYSRQAINDVYLACFPVAAAAALFRWRASRRPRWLVVGGLLLGLGLASKWNAAFPVAVAAALTVLPALAGERDRRLQAAEAGLAVAALVVLPVTVYLLTWWPWLGRGYGLGDLVGFHALMARESATHVGYAGTKWPGYLGEVTQAWRWFVQPVWYVDRVAPAADGSPPGLLAAVTNPAAWLLVWPAAAAAAFLAWRRRERAAGPLGLLFLSAYLPFIAVTRPVWTNSAVSVLPWAAALLGLAASRLGSGRPRWIAAWLLAVVVLGLLLWFPATGLVSAPTDALLHALVPPSAFLPRPGAL